MVGTRRETATHRGLDPDKIVASALAVADAEGLGAVTIRRLAQQHDVTPMALYRHFRDKDELLDAIADRLLSAVALPEPDDRPWHEQTRDVLAAFLAALRPHPNVAQLTLARILTSAPGLALAERTLALLHQAGYQTDQAARIGRQVLCSLITLVSNEPGVGQHGDAEAREDAVRAETAGLAALPPRRYPHVVAAAGALTSVDRQEDYYRLGLDLAVAGLRGVSPAA
ncbi:TetR family transcriptional regulator [Micromonospora pisi]|uniref:TetR family transcriptional regulator n=1 Tax=Micromonospora pisi TaxID=589240 RepID=A0A495JJ57_9ACTN|nr:TetR/AcrR family transcriptional regulator [Micromonospora pisi]RKR88715.1 TetR family transcriptional regulator [Micromonospora pisi]